MRILRINNKSITNSISEDLGKGKGTISSSDAKKILQVLMSNDELRSLIENKEWLKLAEALGENSGDIGSYLKAQFGGYMYAYISCSKCDNLKPIKGEETYDNGKVVNASELTFTGCDIDFLLIDMLYDYDEAVCSDLIIATKRSFITKPSHEGILYYAKRKSGFKKLEKLIDAGKATMEDFTFDGIE